MAIISNLFFCALFLLSICVKHSFAVPKPETDTTPGNFSVRKDHFSAADTKTFNIKYLKSIWERADCSRPIFLCIGGEGAIMDFAREASIVFELARYFNGTAVFLEHRYYGESLPDASDFGNYTSLEDVDYLEIEQVLADAAEFIPYLRKNIIKCDDTPVITVGGFYSGMLAVWMRMKYPQYVQGAWASSAPLLYFDGGNVAMGAFDSHLTKTYIANNCSQELVLAGWTAINNLAEKAGGLEKLNEIFHLTKSSNLTNKDQVKDLISYVREAMEQMAILNYPYETDYPNLKLQAWPIQDACKNLSGSSTSDDVELSQRLFDAINVYYNKAPDHCIRQINETCWESLNPNHSSRGKTKAWTWQKCTEFIITRCSAGKPNDFFLNECPDCGKPSATVKKTCETELSAVKYNGSMYEMDTISKLFGFNFESTSNIIFTNGALDPWTSGGVSATSKIGRDPWHKGIYTFEMENAAHQLDLKQPNSCDPPAVTYVRQQIATKIIPSILAGSGFEDIKLPIFGPPNTTCVYQYSPWGVRDTPITTVSGATVTTAGGSGGSGGSTGTGVTGASGATDSTGATGATVEPTTTGAPESYSNFILISVFLALVSQLL